MTGFEELAWVLSWSVTLIKLQKKSEINSTKLIVFHYIWSLVEDLEFEELNLSQGMFAVWGPVFKLEQLL